MLLGEISKGQDKLLIVDEAHHYYHSDMIQKIIKHYKPEYQLLLTGTPSPFVKSKEFTGVHASWRTAGQKRHR